MTERSAVVGIHAVRTALKFGADGVTELWLDRQRRDRRFADLITLARAAAIPVHTLERSQLDQAAPATNHQGVLAWVRVPAARSEAELAPLIANSPTPPVVLVLDGITDPHNLGACLRTAEAVGATAVVAPRDQAVGLTPAAVKVASGAAHTMPFIQVTNLARTLEALKQQGLWIFGTQMEAPTTLFANDLRSPLALVLGSEGKGLRPLTVRHCDVLMQLPMSGAVESLNVSVTAGICLYEVWRQRQTLSQGAAGA